MGTAGIIALIVGALAAIVGTGVNAYNVKKTNDLNREIAGQQNQFNLEMWNRQNEYNDPVAQVQRLTEAGLNPSLAYGQSGLVDAGNAQEVHPAAGATMQPFQMDTSQFTQLPQQALMVDSQIKANDAYAEKMSADADATRELLPEQVNKLKAESDELKQAVTNMQTQIAQMESFIRNMDQDTAKKECVKYQTLFFLKICMIVILHLS